MFNQDVVRTLLQTDLHIRKTSTSQPLNIGITVCLKFLWVYVFVCGILVLAVCVSILGRWGLGLLDPLEHSSNEIWFDLCELY